MTASFLINLPPNFSKINPRLKKNFRACAFILNLISFYEVNSKKKNDNLYILTCINPQQSSPI